MIHLVVALLVLFSFHSSALNAKNGKHFSLFALLISNTPEFVFFVCYCVCYYLQMYINFKILSTIITIQVFEVCVFLIC